jgi:hypothetical protein
VAQSWNGAYLAPGTCSGTTHCLDWRCAPRGHYQAKLCACASLDSSGNCTQLACVTVPFDYPSSARVIGTVPTGDI